MTDALDPCTRCAGRGYVGTLRCRECNEFGAKEIDGPLCPACQGTGGLDLEGPLCPKCKGLGALV